MSAVVLNFRDPNWLSKRMTKYAVPNKSASGHLPEHRSALTEYAALPWYTRAFKHARAWFGNKRLALARFVLSRGAHALSR